MKYSNIVLISVLFLAASCDTGEKIEDEKSDPLTAVPDSVFTALFLPDTVGFAGADGVYSQLLPDGRTLWIFGDTFIGNLAPGNKRFKTDPLYIRNSFVLFDEGKRITMQQGDPEEFKSMMIPPEVADGSSGKSELELWYWPGDAFMEGGNLKVFVSKFSKSGEGMWDFKFEGTELVTFSYPDFKFSGVDTFSGLNEIHYGHAVCETDSFTYIYGLKDGNAYAARAETGNVADGNWEFFTGNGWSGSSADTKPMLDFSGSEQFSVFPYEDKFIMIMQEGSLSNRIFAFTADSPTGPWSEGKLVYEIPVPEENKNIFTYNALAHPQFTKEGMLLISYNTNSFELEDHFNDALIYRPRFIRVPIDLILKN
jgi:hypothetical protein